MPQRIRVTRFDTDQSGELKERGPTAHHDNAPIKTGTPRGGVGLGVRSMNRANE